MVSKQRIQSDNKRDLHPAKGGTISNGVNNEYLSYPAVIREIRQQTSDTKTFKVNFADKKVAKSFTYKPGQFMEVGLLGVGEAPISISSSPSRNEYLEFCIRCMGRVTNAICNLRKGDILFLRGPYGNCFPFEEIKQNNLYFIAGGIGLAPLRSIINLACDNRGDFSDIKILYGAKSPQDLCFREELKLWQEIPGVEVLTTVDKPSQGWPGNIGVVTSLLDQIKVKAHSSIAFVCGPPIMMKFTIAKLLDSEFKQDNIFVTLERHMKCGIGKCGHCNIAEKFICIDGPVFSYAQLKDMKLSEGSIF